MRAGPPILGRARLHADDGGWDGFTSEGDCVGEDVENIVGAAPTTAGGQRLDPLEGRGPRIEPLGANQIEGGGGDDVMDGRGGPDVYEGGGGTDTVTYGGAPDGGRPRASRANPAVNATIDGGRNDGGRPGP